MFMNTQKFRKHPGGAFSLVKWIKWWIIAALLFSVIAIPFSLFIQFNLGPEVEVIKIGSKTVLKETPYYVLEGGDATKITLPNTNILNIIIFDTNYPMPFFSALFSLIIVWQLYLIFKRLEIDRPFHKEIPKRIKYIGILLIISSLFTFLRIYYMDIVIRNLTDNVYRINYKFHYGDISSIKIGVLVLVIAAIYKQGCRLQHEQDLTI